jgi:hypothetical protein
METQHLEILVVEVDVCHKPLLKASELLLLLLHLDIKPILGIPQCMEAERMIVSSVEVGRVAPLYILVVR